MLRLHFSATPAAFPGPGRSSHRSPLVSLELLYLAVHLGILLWAYEHASSGTVFGLHVLQPPTAWLCLWGCVEGPALPPPAPGT